jgi:adenylate cyclase
MIEIERKFLVRNSGWGEPVMRHRIEQGYLFIADDRTMRIRRRDDAYILTLKVGTGMSRHEVEMPVDALQGKAMLENLCVAPPLAKTRLIVDFAGKRWEIDVFDGVNKGLIVAEIELDTEDEAFELPPWAGPEVTDDPRFFNAALAGSPFSDWGLSYEELLAEKTGGPAS